jgi:type IV pilus assembly protein PilA
VKAVVTRVVGETTANLMDTQLKAAGAQAGVSALEVIQSLKGRGVAVLRFDGDKVMTLPGAKPVTLPAFSLLIRIDGLGGALDKALSGVPLFKVTDENGLKLFSLQQELPVEGLKPVFAIEGKALYLATSIGFLNEFRGQKAGLDQNPDYRRALAAVGTEGNGVCYMTPRLFARLRQIPSLNPDADPETKNVLAFALAEIPETTQPLIAERINLPDGILVRSQWYRSMKQDIAMLAVYNPVTIGIAAAMAIPAFNKVKETSQEKAIHNNLQAFASAAQQFMLESGKDTATYEDVVGPDKLVTELKPVAGEDYENLAIHSGDTSISVETAAGKTITYEW